MAVYSPSNDNVKDNSFYQGIPEGLPEKTAMKTDYPSIDDLHNATLKDNFIYLSTTDLQHECYASGALAIKENYTCMSGYFTNEATALNRVKPGGTFDAYGFHRDVCVNPTIYATNPPASEPMDKRHLDYFYVDRDRMEGIYGTRDFNAAIGKCYGNNQYGSDGGDQGYNAALTELYNNGCLKYAGTFDANPASTLRCREELGKMQDARQEKCSAFLCGASPEDVQKIGYPLDPRCHDQTAFKSEPIANLDEKYKDHKPTYNQDLAASTTPDDRKYSHSVANTPPEKQNTVHGETKSKETNVISENAKGNSGPEETTQKGKSNAVQGSAENSEGTKHTSAVPEGNRNDPETANGKYDGASGKESQTTDQMPPDSKGKDRLNNLFVGSEENNTDTGVANAAFNTMKGGMQ